MNKKEFINSVLEYIAKGQKLLLVKLIKDTSKNRENYKSIGLMQCKDFMDEHMSPNTKANAELIWKFSKGKLKENEK